LLDRSNLRDDTSYAEALARQFIAAEAFWDTDAGRAINRNSRQYIPWFDANGNFQIPDVLPGTYELEIAPTSLKKTAESGAQAFYPPKSLGKLVIPVVISDALPGSRIDLGRLVLRPGP
jgi:hypothetical protein